MVNLLVALVLVTAAPPPPVAPPCCLRPQAIMAEETDTETSHRIGHVVSPAVMTTAFYGGAIYLGANKKQARIAAVALSLAAIIGKELYDYNSEARSFSTLDVALGLGGTAVGLWAAEAITWPEEKPAGANE
jgi:hypothetical protein